MSATNITASATAGRRHVVVVGCGFGGPFAAKALRRADVVQSGSTFTRPGS